MPSRQELCQRGCVKSLIEMIEQVPARAAARWLFEPDDAATRMLVLWTLLRWERTFAITCLESMGVDMWALTKELDELLTEKTAENDLRGVRADATAASRILLQGRMEPVLQALLDQAQQEARRLQTDYLGGEHLLLAIITSADGPLKALLSRHDVTHEHVTSTILEALDHAERPKGGDAALPALVRRGDRWVPATSVRPDGPNGAHWDTPAVGVPRRFGMAVLMLIVTMYAVLFAAMRVLDAHPVVFVAVAILVTGVGLGQMFLFGGKYPRAASIWAGACLFPVEILGALIYVANSASFSMRSADIVGDMFCFLVFSIPLGAGFGYLMGGLTAGVFLLIEIYFKKRES